MLPLPVDTKQTEALMRRLVNEVVLEPGLRAFVRDAERTRYVELYQSGMAVFVILILLNVPSSIS